MREPLVIAVAQPPCMPYDVAVNAVTHAATVRSAEARVVVFPELSLTGYELDAPAIRGEDPRLSPLVEACAETGSLALVGAPVNGDAGRMHIATLAVEGTGATVAYCKLWLATTESNRFSPGDKPAALDVDGWRLGLAICKDTGIPQHASGQLRRVNGRRQRPVRRLFGHLDVRGRRARPDRAAARRHRTRDVQLTTNADKQSDIGRHSGAGQTLGPLAALC